MRYERPEMEIVEVDIMNVFCDLSGEKTGEGEDVPVWG